MVRKAKDADLKSCIEIIGSLPDYFDATDLKKVKKDFKKHDLFVFDDDGIKGLISLNNKSELVTEILWLAVKKEYQGIGIGQKLLEHTNKISRNKTIEVKTLDEKAEYEPYVLTRKFYEKNGFKKIKTIDNYPGWSPENPCAVYRKNI